VNRERTDEECVGDKAGRKDVCALNNTHRRRTSCR
jgi:hypothetical protein